MKFVPRGQINNIPSLVQIMAWHRPGDKPSSEAMMVSLLTHICITRPQWVKAANIVLGLIWCWCNLLPNDPMTHMAEWYIYASVNQVVIGSNNGLLPIRCQAITFLGLKRYAEPTIRYDTRYSAHDTIRSAIHFNDLPLLAEKQRLVTRACDQEHRTPHARYWLGSNDAQ